MAKQHNEFKLGVFTLLIIGTSIAVLLWISKGVGGDMKPITIHFKPTPVMPPLASGSIIYVGGQKVGQVDSSELVRKSESSPEAPSYFVEVHAQIRQDIVLREDCIAFAEGPPLGGDGIIKIDLGQSEKPLSAAFIDGAEPGGFAAILASMQSELDGTHEGSLLWQIKAQLDPEATASLMAKLHQSLTDINMMTASLAKEMTPAERATIMAKFHEIADNINETTAELKREFDTGRPNVMIAKLHAAMDAINDGLTVVTRILANGEAPITNTLLNVEATSEHLSDETDAQKPESLMAHLKQTGELINGSLKDINEVTKTTRDVMVLNRENINRMLENFKESSDHLKTGVKYVLRNPWQLLNPPTAAEKQQQSIFDAARSFSEAATRIDDASAQLRALAELHDGRIPGDDPDLARIRADLEKSAELYSKAEAEVWRQLGK